MLLLGVSLYVLSELPYSLVPSALYFPPDAEVPAVLERPLFYVLPVPSQAKEIKLKQRNTRGEKNKKLNRND